MTKEYRDTNILRVIGDKSFIIGLSIRLLLMVLLPMLMDDGVLLQGVKYTDIDYDVFTDAAEHVANNKSPFMRHTYRYTPFLAVILSYASSTSDVGYNNDKLHRRLWSYLMWWRHPKYFGKLLFCIADALCGLIIVKLRQYSRSMQKRQPASERKSENKRTKIQDALWWLYNPLPINICTRGSGESFVVLLPVLFTLVTVMSSTMYSNKYTVVGIAALAGIIHGLAVHAKLYPIIYTISFMAYLSFQEHSIICKTENKGRKGWCSQMKPVTSINMKKKTQENRDDKAKNRYPFPWRNPKRLYELVMLWIHRLLFTTSSIIFLVCFLMAFGGLTFLAVHFYGQKALDEGLLYHFSRVDHRHNYSMFWYWIYLARGKVARVGADMASSTLSTIGKSLILPQIVLLLYTSLGIAPYDLPFALFIQTFSFVAQNKVMTAQYFTWYLVLLPLCSDRIKWKSRSMVIALSLLGVSIVTWLGNAFLLEMKGMDVHLQVWLASISFFVANVNLLRVILNSYDNMGTFEHFDKHKVQ